jgi:octaprenyl-diphosphate synthase
MDRLVKISKPIVNDLDLFKATYRSALDTSNPLLKRIVEHVGNSTGKMMRPILTFLTANLCGGVTDKTIRAAVSLELLHEATLIHDDVVDNSSVRRGKPSVMAEFKNKAAVLSGDFFLSSSLHEAAESKNIRVVEIISSLGRILIEGELLQLRESTLRSYNEDTYFSIIKSKTAALFSASAKLGAITANDTSEESIQKFAELGEAIGICFQIKDDLFDLQPDNQAGKPYGNDIQEGKVTLPVIYAYNKASKEEKIAIDKYIVDRNVDKIIEIVNLAGGIEYSNQVINEYYTKAVKILQELPSSESKDSIELYVDFLLSRNK